MKSIEDKRKQEKETITFMISLYCKRKHNSNVLCLDCQSLVDYAEKRIDRCPFMESKTFCSKCQVHCYSTDKQLQIKEVMRFSGPRMLLNAPKLALNHMVETWKGS